MKKAKGRQGFASMTPERLREISSKGGKSVPPEKRAFSLDRDLATSAGLKGGVSVPPEKRAFSQDHDLAVSAGRAGGLAKAKPKPTLPSRE